MLRKWQVIQKGKAYLKKKQAACYHWERKHKPQRKKHKNKRAKVVMILKIKDFSPHPWCNSKVGLK